ncbi:CBR-NLP-19 protein [Ditylenchus destructor]|uniref:CBR-NLP-19 protein n=1 Tax=Ditylenchus destructor TaxID=166010 RepID=A0AAD4N8U0_9BILA|nr:CBR-NLP-19 protein [Ditylenchus destructor]
MVSISSSAALPMVTSSEREISSIQNIPVIEPDRPAPYTPIAKAILSSNYVTVADDNFYAHKRRIGLRMPNILHQFQTSQGGAMEMYDPFLNMQKRRIGLRLPNIIYVRDLEKRIPSEWARKR